MRLFIGGRYELGRRRAVYELTRLAAAYNAICEQREVCLYDGTFRRQTIVDHDELRYRAYNEPRPPPPTTTTTTTETQCQQESFLDRQRHTDGRADGGDSRRDESS